MNVSGAVQGQPVGPLPSILSNLQLPCWGGAGSGTAGTSTGDISGIWVTRACRHRRVLDGLLSQEWLHAGRLPMSPCPLAMLSQAEGPLPTTSAHPQSDWMGSPLLPPHCWWLSKGVVQINCIGHQLTSSPHPFETAEAFALRSCILHDWQYSILLGNEKKRKIPLGEPGFSACRADNTPGMYFILLNSNDPPSRDGIRGIGNTEVAESSRALNVGLLPVDCDQSCRQGLAMPMGCCPVPLVPILRPATRKNPAAASPFHLPPCLMASGLGGSYITNWEHCPTTHPKTCSVSIHPPSKLCSPCCPAPWPVSHLPLRRGTLCHPAGSCTPARGSAPCPVHPPGPAPLPGWLGPTAQELCRGGTPHPASYSCPIPGTGSVSL